MIHLNITFLLTLSSLRCTLHVKKGVYMLKKYTVLSLLLLFLCGCTSVYRMQIAAPDKLQKKDEENDPRQTLEVIKIRDAVLKAEENLGKEIKV